MEFGAQERGARDEPAGSGGAGAAQRARIFFYSENLHWSRFYMCRDKRLGTLVPARQSRLENRD